MVGPDACNGWPGRDKEQPRFQLSDCPRHTTELLEVPYPSGLPIECPCWMNLPPGVARPFVEGQSGNALAPDRAATQMRRDIFRHSPMRRGFTRASPLFALAIEAEWRKRGYDVVPA